MNRSAEIADASEEVVIEPGDIFACYGSDFVSRFISLETSAFTWLTAPRGLKVSPSHVAIACPRFTPHSDRCFWFESTTLTNRRCLEAGRKVSGVQCHPIGARMKDYLRGGRVDVYRLTPINALSGHAVNDMRADLISWFIREAVSYDAAAAVFSGATLIRSIDKLTGWMTPRMESVFCSQLIAAELMSLCRMNRDNPQRYNPGRLLRTVVQQGTYSRVMSLTNADLLRVIHL